MSILRWMVTLALLLGTVPAWAADPSPAGALADPDTAFRTPGGTVPAVSAIESSAPGAPSESPEARPPGPGAGPSLLDRTPVTVHYPLPMQVAQAAGAPSPPPATPPEASPWIFGATLYAWLPFVTSTSTVDGLPPGRSSWPQTDITLTNIYAGAGEFQLSKGDWGLFGNVAGASLGLKGVILREDPLHPTRTDRSGYFFSSVVSGQYGLAYRLLGQPLDLATWARGTQPLALDLLAGAQTFYLSASVKTERDQVAVSTTLTSPLVGARLSWDMAARWNLGLGGSLGGFGVDDTSLTWQADLTVAYRFRMGNVPGAVSLGFRVQGLDFETGSNADYLKIKETLYGPLLGFSMFF